MKKLNVYAEKTIIGHLIEQGNDQLSFRYDSDWLKNNNAIVLSPELALADVLYVGEAVKSFFENLLPEGDVLEFISQTAHISSDNTYGLLERFGGDTAGAFSILPDEMIPSDRPHYLQVTKQKIKQWFQQSKGIPLNIQGEQARMSLFGAQDKMTVWIDAKGELFILLGSAPSSHIIKPSLNHRLDIPHTALMRCWL